MKRFSARTISYLDYSTVTLAGFLGMNMLRDYIAPFPSVIVATLAIIITFFCLYLFPGKPMFLRFGICVAIVLGLSLALLGIVRIYDSKLSSKLVGNWEAKDWIETFPFWKIRVEKNQCYIIDTPDSREIRYDYEVSGKILNTETNDDDGFNYQLPIIQVTDKTLELKDGRKTFIFTRFNASER